MNQKRPPSAKKFIRKQKTDVSGKKPGLKVRKPTNADNNLKIKKAGQESASPSTKTGGLKIKNSSNQTGGLKIKSSSHESNAPSSNTSGLKIKASSNQTGGLKMKKAGSESSLPEAKSSGLKIKSASNQTNSTGLSIKKANTSSHILRRKQSGNDTASPDGLKVKKPGGKTQGVGLKVKQNPKTQIEKIQANVLNQSKGPVEEEFKVKPPGGVTLQEQAYHAQTPSNGIFGNIKPAVKKDAPPAGKVLKKAYAVSDPLLNPKITPPASTPIPQNNVATPKPTHAPSFSSTPAQAIPIPEVNEYQDSVGNSFCLIPQGNYIVGSDNRSHQVTVPYGLGKYQVTKEQFFTYLNETGQSYPQDELNQINAVCPYSNCPIVNVSWNDAKNYCRWLRKVTGEYYNLPTSYEWEAAARGSMGLHQPWGEKPPTLELALFNDGINEPISCASVEYFSQNVSPFGVVGMIGNAMEWTNDSFDDDRDPHILKGGSWRSPIDFCNTHSSVVSYPPSRREDYFGFRIIHVPAEFFKDYYIANMT